MKILGRSIDRKMLKAKTSAPVVNGWKEFWRKFYDDSMTVCTRTVLEDFDSCGIFDSLGSFKSFDSPEGFHSVEIPEDFYSLGCLEVVILIVLEDFDSCGIFEDLDSLGSPKKF
ncbi:hypothetical protein WN51_03794 [Melipona quadrifasciata]|uniref:Uncharacterized protein n=1 Tax=Melipona quadrifasciata TaxID=166423 RepID=A0A0M8ZUY6_9HYME|nr:hypothetical protein WN51_03794 [Melipona quadrifasciata]